MTKDARQSSFIRHFNVFKPQTWARSSKKPEITGKIEISANLYHSFLHLQLQNEMLKKENTILKHNLEHLHYQLIHQNSDFTLH